jgi:hypothetical protein
VECIYPLYAETYQAVEDALRREDTRALRAVSLTVSHLAGPEAAAAAAAQLDALNHLPMRAKVRLPAEARPRLQTGLPRRRPLTPAPASP